MTEAVRRLRRRRVATDVLATVAGAAALAVFVLRGHRTALYLGAYGLLVGTSTGVVTFCLTRFTGITVPEARGGATAGANAGSESAEREDAEGEAPDASRDRSGNALWRVFTGAALESDADIQEDTGWLIGRLENVVVLTLVLAGAYTALSIIFAAKSWVRLEDTASENSTYYLAGTLVNFTYSITVGLATVRVAALA